MAADNPDYDITIYSYPPINDHYAIKCLGHVNYKPQPFLVRDRALVDAADILLSMPLTDYETFRSGTWYTTRYALQQDKPVVLIQPNGTSVPADEIERYLLPGKWGER